MISERERWRNVRRAPGYRVSSYCRVRSVDRTLADGRQAGGVPLQQFRDDDGYWCVNLNGERVRVHLLGLEAFVGPRPYGMEGCHGPDGQDDNRVSQLRWDTHEANLRQMWTERKARSEGGTYPHLIETPVAGDVH